METSEPLLHSSDEPPLHIVQENGSSYRSSRFSKDPDRMPKSGSSRELARLLVSQLQRDVEDLRNTLAAVKEQLKAETQRADNAEHRAMELALRFKSMNDARIAAQQDAQRVNQELHLYKLQLNSAQREIERAQEIIDDLEAQRAEAEEAAARARSSARRIKEANIIQVAREEGRQQGLWEGFREGRNTGFEEGRAERYARAGEAATRPGRHYAESIEELYAEDGADASNSGLPRNYDPTYTASTTSQDTGLRPPPPQQPVMSAPAPVPNPSEERPQSLTVPAPASGQTPSDAQEIHPIPIRNVSMSPSHPPVPIPPDGWIPPIDNDSRIRLPAPHELAPAPPTPSPPQSLILQNVTNEEPPLMVPPPSTDTDSLGTMDTELVQSHPRSRISRRRSAGSQSTTMSQFPMLNPPLVSSARDGGIDRRNTLGVISEERDHTPSASSPTSSQYIASTEFPFYVPPGGPQPSMTGSSTQIHHGDEQRRGRPPHFLSDSRDLAEGGATMRPSSQSRSRTSSMTHEIDIEVEPPSGSPSETAYSMPTTPHLLSADNVPLPAAERGAAETPQDMAQAVPPQPIPGQIPILADGQLPPYFQPIGLPVPADSFMSMTGGTIPQGMYMPSTGPTGVPLPPPSRGNTPLASTHNPMPGALSPLNEPVVIPHLMAPTGPMSSGTVQSSGRYSRSALRDSSLDSDSDGTVDSLTTPRALRRDLPGQANTTPGYPVAPVPPHVVYPSSPSVAAAEVPLPPSRAASVVSAAAVPLPASTAGSVMSPRSTSYRSLTRTEERVRSNMAANATPSRPPSAANSSSVSSPTFSQLSIASGSTSKKSKKRQKSKSKFPTVEEVPDEAYEG
ncbi:hypothetical protein WOLCODRAFT_88821 [Wolfiporia cocos MD-104 SS10]|uniref:Uncharacterized protein n=1 Tax=Wolfiporia cocos (strain MD-104) TaxID=742152 RepID=A0A2H3JSM5_WOLCO|nr:hypothetical protein WOLCODRAFT_88821 [Wolfiporia cocos MD-104 SS10]